jgi:hypothetical protein
VIVLLGYVGLMTFGPTSNTLLGDEINFTAQKIIVNTDDSHDLHAGDTAPLAPAPSAHGLRFDVGLPTPSAGGHIATTPRRDGRARTMQRRQANQLAAAAFFLGVKGVGFESETAAARSLPPSERARRRA